MKITLEIDESLDGQAEATCVAYLKERGYDVAGRLRMGNHPANRESPRGSLYHGVPRHLARAITLSCHRQRSTADRTGGFCPSAVTGILIISYVEI
jgi:hypothetical protein